MLKNNNLDVWAIQNYKEELNNALKNIKQTSKDNILFTNCACNFTLGNTSIETYDFNTMLYGEDSDTLILLLKNSEATPEMIKAYLDKSQIPYHEVEWSLLEEKTENNILPKELWFAREKYVLEDALEDSKTRGVKTICYYPEITGEFEIKYALNENHIGLLDKRVIKGVLEDDSKIIVLINRNQNNLTERVVYDCLLNSKLRTVIRNEEELESLKTKGTVLIK